MRRSKRSNARASRRRRPAVSDETMENYVPGAPAPSGGERVRPVYNPTWNPQFFKVARRIMYSVPAADVVSPYIQDPSVGCSATALNHNTGAISFRVGDVYNVTEFGNLFDQYRICAVKLEFHYITASEAAITTTVNNVQNCTLALYEDYDDSTAPTSSLAGWNAILESGRAKTKVFPNSKGNVLTYVVNPKYLQADVDNSAGTTGRNTADGFLDGATSPDVIWRGLKWAIQSNPGATTIGHYFRVYETFYLAFRQRQ